MTQSVFVIGLRFEHHAEGQALGTGTAKPRISWKYTALGPECRDWVQDSYDIELQRQPTDPDPILAASTPARQVYHVNSTDSLFAPWPTTALSSREIVSVRVRGYGHCEDLVDEQHVVTPTAWSNTAVVEAGLLHPSDWSCEFVGSGRPPQPDEPLPPLLFRREFLISPDRSPLIKCARIYATAYGLYELFLNGSRVGDQVLAPGWTEYSTRLEYQTYDVTKLLQSGPNVVAVEVAEGWFAGRLGYSGGIRNIWGAQVAFMGMLVVDYEDKTEISVASDAQWKWSQSPTTSAEIYDGEHFDSLQDPAGWSTAGFDDGDWEFVKSFAANANILSAPLGPPIRIVEEIPVKQVVTSPSGKTILDFGQNLVGYLRFSVQGGSSQKGKTITLRHAEVLEHGEIATEPLRFAKAADTVILSDQPMVWSPKFTFHGFRYAQVDGLESILPLVSPTTISQLFTAIVIHSDMTRTGWFTCSNPLLNQLHSNIVWSMRGNFVGVPTDCPQRDERLGYTGDLQAFASTGSFLYDTCGMLSTWLRGLAADQDREGLGVPPMYSPNIHRAQPNYAAAVWGDCTVIVPWELYRSYGDAEILRTQYPSMRDWVEKGIKRDSRGLWDSTATLQLGDWLDPYAPVTEPASGATDPQLVANAYLVYVSDLMAQINVVLESDETADRYRQQAFALRKAFQDEYTTHNGRVVSDSQTSLALAIYFHLLPSESEEQVASARLAYKIQYHSRFKIGTGFVGTPILGHALTQCGKSQLFYRMLLHKKNPSWLYPITMGATTVWERWDSMLPDGSVNSGTMTSFNHYALGAVGDWLHKTVAGLRCLAPGWKRFVVNPVPGGDLTFTEAKFDSPCGLIKFHWSLLENGTRLKASLLVPPNTTAELLLPGQKVEVLGSGSYDYDVSIEQASWPPLPIYPPYMPHDDDEP
ncbi:bacterial alpha-L-rhamnosidase-domain-containing protein [Leptodontidium sp. MPI-SDFR-AT-0119]|nr:bacterial alpha-L-rhamnosidase-domain-containing protein [Leptodontidium sp. MPI-SDFR-AT-0119]